ncbi:unnamed protein product [Dovyalis caffra]|uniref:Uncharacterized protein n=1 Tax=Dovyalis caffra TaxID=77055 RepID=A0AAV1RLU8_9ROSI|nr:unnamed protein product [Dovyalis caffra]
MTHSCNSQVLLKRFSNLRVEGLVMFSMPLLVKALPIGCIVPPFLSSPSQLWVLTCKLNVPVDLSRFLKE